MDAVFLAIVLILTSIVFGIDASQKRHRYLDQQGR